MPLDPFLFGRVVDEYGHELEVLEPWALFEVYNLETDRTVVKVETEARALELCAKNPALDFVRVRADWTRNVAREQV